MIAAIAILTIQSCTKNAALDQTSIDLADDDAVSEAVFDDIFNSVDNADIILNSFLKGDAAKSELVVIADSCPSITITHPSDGIWPKTITVDFGTGCSGLYDNTRSGKIIITVSGPRMEKDQLNPSLLKTISSTGLRLRGLK